MMLLIFTFYMLRYFGKKAFAASLLVVIVFSMPRIMSGAHWLTDVVVGSAHLQHCPELDAPDAGIGPRHRAVRPLSAAQRQEKLNRFIRECSRRACAPFCCRPIQFEGIPVL